MSAVHRIGAKHTVSCFAEVSIQGALNIYPSDISWSPQNTNKHVNKTI